MAETAEQFDEEGKEICRSIVINGLTNKALAKKLHENLIRNKFIGDTDDFDDILKNRSLMNLLLVTLGDSLPKDIENSKFGKAFISDHDLFFLCKTDSNLNSFLAKNSLLDLRLPEIESIKKGRKALNSFLSKLRATILDDMELLGTPDRFAYHHGPTAEETIKKSQKKAREQASAISSKKARTSMEDDIAPLSTPVVSRGFIFYFDFQL
jgi:hypothetical protein